MTIAPFRFFQIGLQFPLDSGNPVSLAGGNVEKRAGKLTPERASRLIKPTQTGRFPAFRLVPNSPNTNFIAAAAESAPRAIPPCWEIDRESRRLLRALPNHRGSNLAGPRVELSTIRLTLVMRGQHKWLLQVLRVVEDRG